MKTMKRNGLVLSSAAVALALMLGACGSKSEKPAAEANVNPEKA